MMSTDFFLSLSNSQKLESRFLQRQLYFLSIPKRRKIIISLPFIQCYFSVGHVDMVCGEVLVCKGDMSVRYVVVVVVGRKL